MAHAAGKKTKQNKKRTGRGTEIDGWRRKRAPTHVAVVLRLFPSAGQNLGNIWLCHGEQREERAGRPAADELTAKPLQQPDDIAAMHHSPKRVWAFLRLEAKKDGLIFGERSHIVTIVRAAQLRNEQGSFSKWVDSERRAVYIAYASLNLHVWRQKNMKAACPPRIST